LKRTVLRNAFCLSFLLVFGACSGVAVRESESGDREAYQIRAQRLAEISDWGFAGRVSLDDGEEGGSGKLRWDVQSEHSELDFHGAMGRGAWTLTYDPGKAILR
jgi:outer membrane biogenesis lipoprotein LolB